MPKESARIRVRILTTIQKDGDGYHAFAPALRGCHVGGSTQEEASRNLNTAIRLYLSALVERGLPIPIGCEPEIVTKSAGLDRSPTLAGIEPEQSFSENEELEICVPVAA